MKKGLKIYISGKITGIDVQVAQEYFETVEKELVKAGHTPINPMKLVPYHPDLTWLDYMKEDLAALLACDAILMLDNWTDSKGARVEHAVAKEFGLQLYYSKNHNFF